MSDNDLIRRSDALNALRLGETITKLQARIAALPTVTDLGKTQRIIAARDRRIARLVSALNDARAKGYVTPAEQEPALVLSAALAAQPAPSPWGPIETAPKDGTQFLTWDSHYGIRVGRCVVRPDHDDWLSYMDAYKGSSKGGIRATHWMPLPLAPKEVE